MARFSGQVGFAVVEETKPGIFEEVYKERNYKGDVLSKRRSWSPSEHLNDDISISNEISIISDSFAVMNFGVMRYVRWLKQCFSIESATLDTEKHRITLSLGGVYHVENGNGDSEGSTP